jgi:hypothetical protein
MSSSDPTNEAHSQDEATALKIKKKPKTVQNSKLKSNQPNNKV